MNRVLMVVAALLVSVGVAKGADITLTDTDWTTGTVNLVDGNNYFWDSGLVTDTLDVPRSSDLLNASGTFTLTVTGSGYIRGTNVSRYDINWNSCVATVSGLRTIGYRWDMASTSASVTVDNCFASLGYNGNEVIRAANGSFSATNSRFKRDANGYPTININNCGVYLETCYVEQLTSPSYDAIERTSGTGGITLVNCTIHSTFRAVDDADTDPPTAWNCIFITDQVSTSNGAFRTNAASIIGGYNYYARTTGVGRALTVGGTGYSTSQVTTFDPNSVGDPNIDLDPDHHLKTGSAAIDAGTNTPVTVSTDIDGESRTFNTIVDMGFDEYSGGSPAATGACCVGTECSVTTEAGCAGVYQGDDTVCDPSPCPDCVPPVGYTLIDEPSDIGTGLTGLTTEKYAISGRVDYAGGGSNVFATLASGSATGIEVIGCHGDLSDTLFIPSGNEPSRKVFEFYADGYGHKIRDLVIYFEDIGGFALLLSCDNVELDNVRIINGYVVAEPKTADSHGLPGIQGFRVVDSEIICDGCDGALVSLTGPLNGSTSGGTGGLDNRTCATECDAKFRNVYLRNGSVTANAYQVLEGLCWDVDMDNVTIKGAYAPGATVGDGMNVFKFQAGDVTADSCLTIAVQGTGNLIDYAVMRGISEPYSEAEQCSSAVVTECTFVMIGDFPGARSLRLDSLNGIVRSSRFIYIGEDGHALSLSEHGSSKVYSSEMIAIGPNAKASVAEAGWSGGDGSDSGDTRSIEFIGNTFYTSGTGSALVLNYDETDPLTAPLTIANNIFYESGTGYAIESGDTGWDLTADNNVVYGTGTGYVQWEGSDVANFAAWQALGFDTNGSGGDPLFTSATSDTSTVDLTLQVGSSAIDLADEGAWPGSWVYDLTGQLRAFTSGSRESYTGPVGACCVSAGLGNQGTCTITFEGACSGYWFEGEECSPNPCPTSGNFVDGYNIRKQHPRMFLTPEDVARFRELYNGGDIDPSVPVEIQNLWESVVDDAYNDTSWGIPSSRLATADKFTMMLLGAAYVLTGDQAIADAAETAFTYLASNPWNIEDDGQLMALDVMWDALSESVRTAACRGAYVTYSKDVGGQRVLSKDRRGSGSMNLFGNETYWCVPWTIIYWGSELTTEHGWLSDLMDEGYSRMMGEDPDDTENGFYTWSQRHWPSFMTFPKGPSYGAKYIGEAYIQYATMMKRSGLSDAPMDSIRATIPNLSYYQQRLSRQDGYYLHGYAGSITGPGTRDWVIGALTLMTERTPWATRILLESKDWSESSGDYQFGYPAMLILPDSLTSPLDTDAVPLATFAGREGPGRRKNHDDWYDTIVAKWGTEAWDLDSDGGMLHTEAGVIHRDNFGHGRQLRLSIYHDGTLLGTTGSYNDGSDGVSDHYPYFYTSSWANPVPVVLNNSNSEEAWQAAGPTFLYEEDIIANETTDWVDGGTYDVADIYAYGTADLGDSYIVYGAEKINPNNAYVYDSHWDVTSQERRFVSLLPGRTGGRSLTFVRDTTVRSSSGATEGIWSNFPMIHEPAVVGGSVLHTHDVPGVTANIIDYSSPTYFNVARDTLGWSGRARLYPIAGVSYARKVYGYGIEWWMYTDVTDPVGSGEQFSVPTSSPDFRATRFNEVEAGGGRVEFHAADGAASADISWLFETNALDENPSPAWSSIGAVTSSSVVGVVADSAVLILPNNPNSGGPWSFSWAGFDKDVIVAGLPDGTYTLSGVEAVSADSILVFEDLSGGSMNLAFGGVTPTGACCAADGSCSITTEAGCSGTYEGDDSVCSPNPCPQPTGACCAPDGSCTVTTEAACSHNWLGADTECDPNPCPVIGSCCGDNNGICKVVTAAECSAFGGTFYSGTECDPSPCTSRWKELQFGPKLAQIGSRPFYGFNDGTLSYATGEAQFVAESFDLVQAKSRGEAEPLFAFNDSLINLYDCTFVQGVPWGVDYTSPTAMETWQVQDTLWSPLRIVQYAYWRNLFEDGTDFGLKQVDGDYINVWEFRACNWTDECPLGTWGWTAGMKWSEVCQEALRRVMERPEFMDNFTGFNFDTFIPWCCWQPGFVDADYDGNGTPDGCTGSCYTTSNAFLNAQKAEGLEFITNLFSYTTPRRIPVLHAASFQHYSTNTWLFSGRKIENWLYQNGALSNEWIDWWTDPTDIENLTGYKEVEEETDINNPEPDSLAGWEWILFEATYKSSWSDDFAHKFGRFALGTCSLGEGFFGYSVYDAYGTELYFIPEMDRETGWRWRLPALTDAYHYTSGGVDQWRRKFFRPNGVDSCMVVVDIDASDAYLVGHGACCIDNECSLMFEIDCTAAGGTYLGDDAGCSPDPCAPTGGCCQALGVCSVETEDDCTGLSGTYLGDDTTCVPNTCPQPGACCYADGTCQVQDLADCVGAGGDFTGEGTSCVPNNCPQPATGACCQTDRTCTITEEADCAYNYIGDGTVCTPNPCPYPTGACCDLDVCTVETQSACTMNGRQYKGDGTVCDPSPCTAYGSCCYGSGLCAFVPLSACNVISGTWDDDGDCDPNPCPQPGACCFGDGSCVIQLPQQCEDVFMGEGTTCSPNPCVQPTGACCDGEGNCVVVTEEECLTPQLLAYTGGEYQGDDTVCDPNPCTPGDGGGSDGGSGERRGGSRGGGLSIPLGLRR